MVSFKRFLHIILLIAVLGGIFLIYNIYENRLVSVLSQSGLVLEEEFTETRKVDGGEKPGVWILGNPEDENSGEIYRNVLQFCEDIHLAVTEVEHLETEEILEGDLVIFCDASISRYANLKELEEFIAGGGRVILAAGLAGGDEETSLWPALGIREKLERKNYHNLVFLKPLLPIQSDWACYYDGDSDSARIDVSSKASVYVQDGESGVPLLYTYAWQNGNVCLINGTFLADVRCMGFLSGAIGAMLPDFIYPVLGVKAVFLDNFPMLTPADDDMCTRLYGYSAEGFVRDVVWPVFQGISIRTDTPYTSSILGEASSEASFGTVNDAMFTTICKSALQFGGELVYAANCLEDGKVAYNEEFISRFTEFFPNYTFQGLVMETDSFSPEMLDIPGADIQSVRGMLGSREMRLSWEEGRTVFPAATMGNSLEDGNLFAIYSVLGAYGMVSHVFDISMLITRDENNAAVWDLDKLQIGFFESAILTQVSWLESRTLTQTTNNVKSYNNLNYGWVRNGNRIELDCSGIVKGQAFFYHTDSRIADAQGLTYEDVGNGYYLLRVQENRGIITLEEGE